MNLKKKLEKQHYGLVGEHSAVKVCTWTKKSLRDEGYCYKQKFYGIRSHLCCQMTPSVGYCQNNCIYCWRTTEHMIRDFNNISSPEEIIEGCIKQQTRLLSGFPGSEKTNMDKFNAALEPMHFAISLSGEPTSYPKIRELIETLHQRGKTTFLVTNGMLPEKLKQVNPTQLYLSLSVPDEKLFQRVHQPLFKDAWQRFQQSLEILKTKKRSTIRATMIKGVNMVRPEMWAEQIEKANPDFVEVKSYMFVGDSRQRMNLSNMPYHEEVREFSEKIGEVSSYKIIDEKEESRVVLMMKKDRADRVMKF